MLAILSLVSRSSSFSHITENLARCDITELIVTVCCAVVAIACLLVLDRIARTVCTELRKPKTQYTFPYINPPFSFSYSLILILQLKWLPQY